MQKLIKCLVLAEGDGGCCKLQLSFFFYLGYVCFLKSDFQKITFQIFLSLFAIRKVSQQKTLSGQ